MKFKSIINIDSRKNKQTLMQASGKASNHHRESRLQKHVIMLTKFEFKIHYVKKLPPWLGNIINLALISFRLLPN